MCSRGLIACLAAGLLCSAPVHAQEPAPRSAGQVDADLLVQLQNQSLENFIARLLAPIRKARRPDRLTREDVEDVDARARVDNRARHVLALLAFDLNGDGAVTLLEAESASVTRGGNRPRVDQRQVDARRRDIERLFEADDNADGRIEVVEMLAWADRQPAAENERTKLSQLILELDANDDGATTVHEAEARARQLFSRYDLDGDGLIDPDQQSEINRVEKARKSAARLQRDAENCGMPPAPKDARIVLFSTHRAQAIASVAIDGPLEATETAAVTIEPGADKLYLVLAADQNMIWRIDGAVDRLTNVVLLEGSDDPMKSAAAVTGVDRSLVFWGPQETCAQLRGSTSVQHTNERLTAIHGRPPAVFEKIDVLGSLSVPSMDFVGVSREGAVPVRRTACRDALRRGGTVFRPEPAEGADAEPCDWIRAEMELEVPGGVVEIDPASVVGRRPAIAYEILPSPFGFRKALDQGVLVDISGGSGARFRIEKPLSYFPPVSGRSRALAFDLADGVEMPRGDARRYCVFDSNGKQVQTEALKRCPPS